MKYNIHLTEEDYIHFNIFYAKHSKSGKQAFLMSRIAFPILAAALIFIFSISKVSAALFLTETVFLCAVSVFWFFYAPKMIEKNIRKNIIKMKADGKLPFHEDAVIEFQDSMIVEKNKQEEIRVKYTDIQHIYFEQEYLYIFYSAAQAFIIPYRCLGEDKDCVQNEIRKYIPDLGTINK